MYNQGARYGHFVNHGSRQALMGYHSSRGRFDQQILRRIPIQEAQRPRVPPGRNAHTASYVQRTHWFPNYRRGNQRGVVQGSVDRRNQRGHRNIVHNQRNQRHIDENIEVCFICGDYLQNSGEAGVHFCDGGPNQRPPLPGIQLRGPQQQVAGGGRVGNNFETLQREATAAMANSAMASTASSPPPISNGLDNDGEPDDIQCQFESLLEDCLVDLQSRYQNVTERLQEGLSCKADEIRKIYQIVQEDRKRTKQLKVEIVARAAELDEREAEIKSLQDKIEKSKRALEEDNKHQTEEISRLWQQLRDEYDRIEDIYKVQKGRIKLDVGGHEFTTSVFTLTRVQDSMLAAMFSGRHEIKQERDGSVFIDRDGTHFRYILNYLRDSDCSFDALPRSKQILRELRNEAIFYQLPGLVQQIEKLL